MADGLREWLLRSAGKDPVRDSEAFILPILMKAADLLDSQPGITFDDLGYALSLPLEYDEVLASIPLPHYEARAEVRQNEEVPQTPLPDYMDLVEVHERHIDPGPDADVHQNLARLGYFDVYSTSEIHSRGMTGGEAEAHARAVEEITRSMPGRGAEAVTETAYRGAAALARMVNADPLYRSPERTPLTVEKFRELAFIWAEAAKLRGPVEDERHLPAFVELLLQHAERAIRTEPALTFSGLLANSTNFPPYGHSGWFHERLDEQAVDVILAVLLPRTFAPPGFGPYTERAKYGRALKVFERLWPGIALNLRDRAGAYISTAHEVVGVAQRMRMPRIGSSPTPDDIENFLAVLAEVPDRVSAPAAIEALAKGLAEAENIYGPETEVTDHPGAGFVRNWTGRKVTAADFTMVTRSLSRNGMLNEELGRSRSPWGENAYVATLTRFGDSGFMVGDRFVDDEVMAFFIANDPGRAPHADVALLSSTGAGLSAKFGATLFEALSRRGEAPKYVIVALDPVALVNNPENESKARLVRYTIARPEEHLRVRLSLTDEQRGAYREAALAPWYMEEILPTRENAVPFNSGGSGSTEEITDRDEEAVAEALLALAAGAGAGGVENPVFSPEPVTIAPALEEFYRLISGEGYFGIYSTSELHAPEMTGPEADAHLRALAPIAREALGDRVVVDQAIRRGFAALNRMVQADPLHRSPVRGPLTVDRFRELVLAYTRARRMVAPADPSERSAWLREAGTSMLQGAAVLIAVEPALTFSGFLGYLHRIPAELSMPPGLVQVALDDEALDVLLARLLPHLFGPGGSRPSGAREHFARALEAFRVVWPGIAEGRDIPGGQFMVSAAEVLTVARSVLMPPALLPHSAGEVESFLNLLVSQITNLSDGVLPQPAPAVRADLNRRVAQESGIYRPEATVADHPGAGFVRNWSGRSVAAADFTAVTRVTTRYGVPVGPGERSASPWPNNAHVVALTRFGNRNFAMGNSWVPDAAMVQFIVEDPDRVPGADVVLLSSAGDLSEQFVTLVARALRNRGETPKHVIASRESVALVNDPTNVQARLVSYSLTGPRPDRIDHIRPSGWRQNAVPDTGQTPWFYKSTHMPDEGLTPVQPGHTPAQNPAPPGGNT
ncbi:hypothetical protein, partial [Streptomyces zaomyceticus]|uniref:hypothetical protein n=1 Tax=Streptomyces zaomyceticus TaxID=68286 RepID=UPI003680CBED